jgi:hypothetical protein
MPLAMQYAIRVVTDVQAIQVVQWVIVLAVRCLDPRKIRMKMYLAVICGISVSFCLIFGQAH